MTSQFRLASSAVLSLVLAFAIVQAARAGEPAGERKAAVNANSGEVTSLRHAYALLKVADHDYDGHRARAMHAIEKACKELGAEVRGDGKADEQQGESDSQLRQAQAELQTVRASVAAGKRELVLRHINNAIEELNIALSIK